MAIKTLNYIIQDPLELNLSFIPFIINGGLFIPTKEIFILGEQVQLTLQLPNKQPMAIFGKVVWITPVNALHHVLPGIGIQFMGVEAETIRADVEASMEKTMEIGGYTCGISPQIGKKRELSDIL